MLIARIHRLKSNTRSLVLHKEHVRCNSMHVSYMLCHRNQTNEKIKWDKRQDLVDFFSKLSKLTNWQIATDTLIAIISA